MDPDSNSNRQNLITLPHFGKIALDPMGASFEELQEAKFVVFPRAMSDAQFPLACEWAARTQVPIYCVQGDLHRLRNEGFYDYRFQVLKGYRRFRFSKGTVEFFPVEKRKKVLFFSMKQEPTEYQTLIHPDGYRPLLFLSSLLMEADDARVLKGFRPKVMSLTEDEGQAGWTRAEALLECRLVSRKEFLGAEASGVYLWETLKIQQEAPRNGSTLLSVKEVENG